MKPIFLICFLVIVVSASAFVAVCSYSTDLVNAYPTIFAAGLTAILVLGMGGMMYSLLVKTTMERQRRH